MYNSKQNQDQLVVQHASLVKRIALHIMGKLPANILLDDLYQAGMLGLLEASTKFDSSKGASFETYAGIRIRGSIIDEVRRGDWSPRSVHRNGRLIAQAISAIEQRTSQDARDEDVAHELEISVKQYHQRVADVANERGDNDLADAIREEVQTYWLDYRKYMREHGRTPWTPRGMGSAMNAK
ncbi:MAG: sigma-70 family RNA polymerase sigma factor [SAR324 cluster bacterium]|nr:sigma-70 family RNA polymerase sigma factor [SAR324 cluster bacterium]